MQKIYNYFRRTLPSNHENDDNTVRTDMSTSFTNSERSDYFANREEYILDQLSYYFHEFSWRINYSRKRTIFAIGSRGIIIIDIDDGTFDAHIIKLAEFYCDKRILLLQLNFNHNVGRTIESPWTFDGNGIGILPEKKEEFKIQMDIVKVAIIQWIVKYPSKNIEIIELFRH